MFCIALTYPTISARVGGFAPALEQVTAAAFVARTNTSRKTSPVITFKPRSTIASTTIAPTVSPAPTVSTTSIFTPGTETTSSFVTPIIP